MTKSWTKQLAYYHKYEKADFRHQLCASTPEAMAKIVPLVIPHPSHSDFFQNLHVGDEFATDVVKIGGPVE
jgi:hypothetical protein